MKSILRLDFFFVSVDKDGPSLSTMMRRELGMDGKIPEEEM